MPRARRLVPMDEVKSLADFLTSISFSYNSVSVSGNTVTFSRLPETITQGIVPGHGQKKRTAFDEFYGTPTGD